MPNDPHPAAELAVNALQEATLLVGYLRTTLLSDVDDLAKIKQAIERATAALRQGPDRDDPRRI